MKESRLKGCFCSKAAFTLIELLVVVLIIGILAAVAFPQYQKAVEKSRVTEAISIMSSVAQAMNVWVLENGYPDQAVFFLGEGAPGELSIDVLQCVPGATCESNFFHYWANCEVTGCEVDASRRENGTETYWLSMYREPNGEWEKECWAEASDRTAPCCSLTAQGWIAMDADEGTPMEGC